MPKLTKAKQIYGGLAQKSTTAEPQRLFMSSFTRELLDTLPTFNINVKHRFSLKKMKHHKTAHLLLSKKKPGTKQITKNRLPKETTVQTRPQKYPQTMLHKGGGKNQCKTH